MTRHVDSADLLVPLGGRGEGPSILLLHPAGGGVLPYLPLAQGLAEHGTVTALRACGLLPGEMPDETIVEAVERYEPVVVDLAPDVLVGWSMGGLLAWELAARLAARSAAPRAVVIIDSAVDAAVDAAGGLSDEHVDRLADLVQAHGLPGAATGSEEERRTIRAHVRANAAHRVEVHQSTPTLVLTCRGGTLVGTDQRWRRLAPATVTLGELPGGHFDVFGAEALPVLLDRIRDLLRSVDLAVVA